MIYDISYLRLEDIRKFITKFKNISYKIENNFLKYLKIYYDNPLIKDLSFLIKTKNNKLFCPLTIIGNKNPELSFYKDPIEIFSEKKIDKETNLLLKKTLSEIVKNNQVKNMCFKVKKENVLINKSVLDNLDKIISEIYLDLNLDLLQIQKDFKQSLRTILRKEYEFLNYEIIDKENYKKDEILNMRKMHILVSGKETRSVESWLQNEKMILDGNAFIVKAIYKNKPISYNFFFFNDVVCIYFFSCTLREYFKTLKNITHKSLWHAISYAKKKSNYFYIGSSTIFSKTVLSKKELNIEKFKKQFNSKSEEYYIFNHIPNFF